MKRIRWGTAWLGRLGRAWAGTARGRARRSPAIEMLERRRVLSSFAPSLPTPTPRPLAAEEAGPHLAHPKPQASVDEMIHKWEARRDHIMAQLTVAGAQIIGLATVPGAIAEGKIVSAAFWKSLGKLERAETALETIDYARNLGETISDPLASDVTVQSALQTLVENSIDWFTSHPQLYKVAGGILAKGASQRPAPAPTPTPPVLLPPPTSVPAPSDSMTGTFVGTYQGTLDSGAVSGQMTLVIPQDPRTANETVFGTLTLTGLPGVGTFTGSIGLGYDHSLVAPQGYLAGGTSGDYPFFDIDNGTLSGTSISGDLGGKLLKLGDIMYMNAKFWISK